jgi:hypothetical protein
MKVTEDPERPDPPDKSVQRKTLNEWQRKDQKQRQEAQEKGDGYDRSGPRR